jgi:thioredoxin-dependent peroxiredoxin
MLSLDGPSVGSQLALPFLTEIPMSSLTVGQPAPAFSLPAPDGSEVSLASLLGKKVVLYFYPKDNTSGCTTQACGFRDNLPAITEKGAVVIGVSRDSSKRHLGFAEKHALPFTLLTDADHAVHEQYGAWGEKKMYGKTVLGVIRTTVLIDEQGVILDVVHKVKAKADPERVLALLG